MLWLLLVVVGCVIALLFFWGSNLKQDRPQHDRLTLNKEVFYSRRDELLADLEAERISQDEFNQLETELEKSLLEDIPQASGKASGNQSHKAIYITLLIAIPVLSLGLYGLMADWKAYSDWQIMVSNNQKHLQSSDFSDTQWLDNLTNREFILLLRSQLHEQPHQTRHWIILAQTLANLGAINQSTQAIERAIATAPDDISTKLTSAQLLARFDNQDSLALAKQLILQVLHQKPQHEGAMAMMGFIYMRYGEYQNAIDTWQALVNKREADGAGEGKGIEVLRQQIETAKMHLAQQQHMDKAAFQLNVEVKLAPSLQSSIPGNARVFVIVKGDDGMPAPVAVKPLSVNQLPIELSLTDADAMMPGRHMSQMGSLSVMARVSLSGTATASSGDYQSQVVQWQTGSANSVSLLIDQQIP